MTTTVEKDQKFASIKGELASLKEKLLGLKKTDLITHQAEIKKLLETQIISRYFYEKGKIEQAFQYDQEILKAYSLFANQQTMLAILKGEGTYKTVGLPLSANN